MTSFVCPACSRSAFHAGAPVFDYTPRRWAVWRPVRKRWIGDLVQCANPACKMLGMAGLNGVFRLNVQAPQQAPPAAPTEGVGEQNGEAPKPRPSSQLHDSDMKWFR